MDKTQIVPEETISTKIYIIRGQKVMFDFDLANLYGVSTKVLNQAVRRNKERFPNDFMFQLVEDEYLNLRSQFVTSSLNYGGRRYLPYAFTEHGVSMLSAVLKSDQAVYMSIFIVRAFIKRRQLVLGSKPTLAVEAYRIYQFCIQLALSRML
jgi:hypothetical protein